MRRGQGYVTRGKYILKQQEPFPLSHTACKAACLDRVTDDCKAFSFSPTAEPAAKKCVLVNRNSEFSQVTGGTKFAHGFQFEDCYGGCENYTTTSTTTTGTVSTTTT